MVKDLPDVQEMKPSIEIPIKQVGVENVEVPFVLMPRNKIDCSTKLVANVSMRANVKADRKGVSMSRFIRTLDVYLNAPLNHKLIRRILYNLVSQLDCDSVYMKFEFRYPKIRKSPISTNAFPLYYKCRFEGQLEVKERQKSLIDNDEILLHEFRFFQGVVVQYASYCPCSNELCNHLRENDSNGFPHAQRSFAHVLVETKEPNFVWLEDIIDDVESSIKTLPFPIIKREDEQRIAEIAYQNPIFVEDAIRQISMTLNKNSNYYDWITKCIHEESIHTSEAVAINWKGRINGFNGNYYL